MDVSKGNHKRVRIMLGIEEAGPARHEKADIMGPNLDSSSTVSLQKAKFKWKRIPRMSEEMVNVMSSFNMMDISKSDTSMKNSSDCKESKVGFSLLESQEDALSGCHKNSSVRGKNSKPIRAGEKHTIHKTGKVTPRVQTPEMKARMQRNGHNISNESKNETESVPNEESCSSKTQKLLARSSVVYGRIDNIRESVKLTRSASWQLSKDKMNSALYEKAEESYENDFETTEIDALDIKPSRTIGVRALRQRSLKKSMSDSQQMQKVDDGQGLRMPPILKFRSYTIS